MIEQPKVKTRGFPAVRLIVIVAVAAMVVGGPAGFAVARAMSATDVSSAPAGPDDPGAAGSGTAEPDAPVSSGALPEFDADFPTGASQYIEGITVPEFAQVRSEGVTGWNCTTDDITGLSGAAERTSCYDTGDLRTNVMLTVEYDDETQIRQVEADCRLGLGSPECASLYAEVGKLVLSGQPDLQQQASDWITQNVDTDESTTFGSVRVQVSLEPASVTFTPAA